MHYQGGIATPGPDVRAVMVACAMVSEAAMQCGTVRYPAVTAVSLLAVSGAGSGVQTQARPVQSPA